MDELQPSKKFVDTVTIQTGFHHDEVDWPRMFSAEAPSLASTIGFQDRVAKAAKNQRPGYESGWIVFDQEDSLHGDATAFLLVFVLEQANSFVGRCYPEPSLRSSTNVSHIGDGLRLFVACRCNVVAPRESLDFQTKLGNE